MSELTWIGIVLGALIASALIAGALVPLARRSARERALRRAIERDEALPEPPLVEPPLFEPEAEAEPDRELERESEPARIAEIREPERELPVVGPITPRPARTRLPIVLAHGFGGIDRIGPFPIGYNYFRGIPASLRSAGHTVHVAWVPPTASIDLRARSLARQVRALDARVNIIAHSMGGLDARLALARYGISDRVGSLTTIGTPHHGTPLADAALAFGEWRRARGVLDRMGLNVDGVYDVSTKRMREFNRRVANAPDVHYASVVAAVNLDEGGVHAMLSVGHSYLLRKAGPNDGVVPAISQPWGETLDEVDADHWAQIGWFGRLDAGAFYARLVERLAERGL
jgi:triacylglycerol lipase